MSSRFIKIFGNATLTVYRKGITDSYTLESVKEEVCAVKADVQPYSSSLSRKNEVSFKEYGLDIRQCLSVYCDSNELLTEGLYCTISGKNDEYIIRYVEHWNNSTMLIIERWNGN